MRIRFASFCTILSLLLISGCIAGRTAVSPPGLLYSHTIKPLDVNQHRTEGASKTGEGDIKHLYFAVTAMWDSNSIGDIAKENGIETIYYADIEKLVVLEILQYIYIGPVWRQYTVHIYGK